MDRRTVSGTRWENRGQFHTRTADRFTMKAGWMTSAPRIVMMKSNSKR